MFRTSDSHNRTTSHLISPRLLTQPWRNYHNRLTRPESPPACKIRTPTTTVSPSMIPSHQTNHNDTCQSEPVQVHSNVAKACQKTSHLLFCPLHEACACALRGVRRAKQQSSTAALTIRHRPDQSLFRAANVCDGSPPSTRPLHHLLDWEAGKAGKAIEVRDTTI